MFWTAFLHVAQGGRTWQPFVGSKNGNENFRQARIYNFRDKCVVFACNRKGAGSFQIHRKTMKDLWALAVLGVREQPNLAQDLVTHSQ